MSAYAHQMEREYEAERLSSRGGSERDSTYIMESGFYITSFVATIFVASLATFAVLFLTLLVTLVVMLQSCQTKNAGILDVPSPPSLHSQTCTAYALHAHLNNFESTQFPEICRAFATRYVEDGQYSRDLNSTVLLVESYLASVNPQDDGLDVFLLDIDHCLLSSNHHYTNLSILRYDKRGCGDCVGVARNLKHAVICGLYTKLRSSGWPVILMTRKAEKQRNMAIEMLHSAGFRDWSLLIMRSEDEIDAHSFDFFSRIREALQRQGFRIRGTISSHLDALIGSNSDGLVFKLPNPIYYQNQNTDT